MIVPCGYISAIAALVWIACKSTASVIVISILYSFFSGGLMALPPAVVIILSPSLAEIGTRIGMAFFVGSLGVLIGSPIAGAILNAQSPHAASAGAELALGQEVFWGVLVFTGITLLLSGVFMTWTRIAKAGLKYQKI